MALAESVGNGRRLRILLTEGSSTSARQAVYALAPFRPVIDACDAKPFVSLVRSSSFVSSCYRCPPFSTDPAGYLSFLRARLRRRRYDVLLPVHDQVFLLARYRDAFADQVGLAVPEFEALEQVQSKVAFARLLNSLLLPQPALNIVRTRDELRQCDTPCYVKLAHGTAGVGLWHARDGRDLAQIGERLSTDGLLGDGQEILVQAPAPGALRVVQSVFQHGRLVGAHCYEARALGVGGSASARVSVAHPSVVEHLCRIGGHLRWHGALMLDYLYDEATDRSLFIEANPRIGETVNATLSGVNLCALLTEVSLGHTVEAQPPSRPGVRTHALLMRMLAAAQSGGTRGQVWAELVSAWKQRGDYAASEDELTRLGEDPPSLVPALVLATQLLINPRSAENIVQRAVGKYSLTEATVHAIRQMPAELATPRIRPGAPGSSRGLA